MRLLAIWQRVNSAQLVTVTRKNQEHKNQMQNEGILTETMCDRDRFSDARKY